MPLELFDFEQNSSEWDFQRSQVITASNMKLVLAKGEGKTRNKYARQIAAARYRGEAWKDWEGNADTERGHEWEPLAVEFYKTITGHTGTKLGFALNHQGIGGIGYSPDYRLDHGLLEIKTRKPDLQIELLESGKVPSEHAAQIQTGLWVMEEEWLDFMCYCKGMPAFLRRVYRDDSYIKNMQIECIKFYSDVNQLQELLINYDTRGKWI